MTTGADIFELTIADTPPSLNSMGWGAGRGSAMKYHRLKKKWEGLIGEQLEAEGVPKDLTKVHATARCRFRTRHKRDEGNFRWLVEKALGDILQSAGHLRDDSVDEFTFGGLTIEPDKGDPRTVLTLEVWR